MKHLSLQEISEYCIKKAKTKVKSAEIIAVRSSGINARCRLGKIETLERSESTDLGIRVILGKKKALKQAVVSTSNITQDLIDQAIERAVEMAMASTPDPFLQIVEPEMQVKKPVELDLYDAKEPSPEKIIKYAQQAEEAAFKVKNVTNSEDSECSFARSDVTFATSLGFEQSYNTSSASIAASIVAGKGTNMETDYDYTAARHFADLKSPAQVGKTAGERAVRKLNPRKIKTMQVPVVFEYRVAREIIEILASAINGTAVARKTSFLKDKLGKKILGKGINIVDDPLIKRAFGSKPFDGEGINGKKLKIVSDGVLKHLLLDTKSANQLGLKTNGRAVRGVSSTPSPSHTNIYLEPGKKSPSQLISGIKSGLFITEAFGFGVNMITGDYSQGAAGFWIENGKISYPVSEITIAGHLLEIFQNITPANDLKMLYSMNSPSLLIEGMTIAGT